MWKNGGVKKLRRCLACQSPVNMPAFKQDKVPPIDGFLTAACERNQFTVCNNSKAFIESQTAFRKRKQIQKIMAFNPGNTGSTVCCVKA
jgi:hypothetical protein